MSRDELIALLNSLTIEKIESFNIQYVKERRYGMYNDDNKSQTISYNE